MVKIEAIVREEVYEEVKDALESIGVHGITVSQVMGCGNQMGYTSIFRGSEVHVNMLPKIKFEIVLSRERWVDKVVDAICEAAYTGQPGDGKIFVYPVEDAIRIRTKEHGEEAIWASKKKQR